VWGVLLLVALLACFAEVFVYPGSGATCDTQELKKKLTAEQQQTTTAAAAGAAANAANGPATTAACDEVKVEPAAPVAPDEDTSHMVS
jgi:hypothetical protein